jgi:16S rRNA (guanine527-N7)-methyltransferase
MDERVQLVEGAKTLGLSLDAPAVDRLLRLLDELSRWNEAYNLTAIVDRPSMITHHLLDSLSIHADVQGRRVADVGTGAGFPGLPLAIAAPDRHFTLIDSNNKKVRFVAHVARLLGLANVTAAHARVENLGNSGPFDTVTTRAFASLPDIVARVGPICGPSTRVLAMKGRIPDDEMAALTAGWRVAEARIIAVPGLAEARSLIVIERV